MEHLQSRPIGTEGRKATHDFLSLYSHSTVHQQDPRLLSQGNSLRTHDFLQPLEQAGEPTAKKESTPDVPMAEKPTTQASAPSLEQIVPGGRIGAFSTGHVYHFNQKFPKPEGTILPLGQGSSTANKTDGKFMNSSHAGSGFTLWEESLVKKGKTRKENEATELEKRTSNMPSQLSSGDNSSQKSQSILEMIKSAKGSIHEEDTDDGEEFTPKRESPVTFTNTPGDLRVKVEGKSHDRKPNTPRSKHSATEQRRRCKINDRFQKLRQIIPHSDQKRDKASFLLEVIEYIQFLQDKVHKFEGPYQGWTHDQAKVIPWRDNQGPTSSHVDFPSNVDDKILSASPSNVASAMKPVETSISSQIPAPRAVAHQSGPTNKTVPFPLSLQSRILSPRLPSDAADSAACQLEAQLRQNGSSIFESSDSRDKSKKQEMAIEGGSISISSVYSHGLSSALTKALQNSGVDLSKARISVQIQLGKRANSRQDTSISTIRASESPPINQGAIHSRDASCDKFDQALKKFKTSKN